LKKHIAALVIGIVVGISVVFGSGAVFAAKPGPAPAPHRHYIMVNEEKVYVGPDFCEVAASEQGWVAYHYKVHLTNIGEVFSEDCPL
jgi:hypothetical protein